ncbi:MAG: type 2 isopentenyl-diphosphate Delta-isomerase [Candidatus Altiarchaeota archaeon]
MINSRKIDHLRICVEEDVEAGDAGFSSVNLVHKALPELDYDEIDTRIQLLGKKLGFPLIIESMTGGTKESESINKDLALIAQEYGIGMGLGSQRAAIEDKQLSATYTVRDVAPDILLIANLGAVQLNHEYSEKECMKAIDMVNADAIALHINPLQEIIQPEGDRNFKGLISKINSVKKSLKKPVILKGVGEGISLDTASRITVDAFDVGGVGGTSWSLVESHRLNGLESEIGMTFAGWGIPTVECVRELRNLKKPLIASGGVRSGLDAAKAIAVGADAVGVALPLLRAYNKQGLDGLRNYLDKFISEFKAAMFLTGCIDVRALKGISE